MGRMVDGEVLGEWVNGTGEVQVFYEGHGRKIRELPALPRLRGDRMRRDVRTGVVRLGCDPTDFLSMTIEGTMHLFGPETVRIQ